MFLLFQKYIVLTKLDIYVFICTVKVNKFTDSEKHFLNDGTYPNLTKLLRSI